jgi:hypothetical protein
MVTIKLAAATRGPCPVREQCTRSESPKFGRQLTVPPREVHHAPLTARTLQNTKTWQARYATRASVAGTIRQGVTVCGLRHTHHRGLPQTHPEHVYSATALTLIRLDAWWNGHPLDRTRTNHLTRLELTLAARPN